MSVSAQDGRAGGAEVREWRGEVEVRPESSKRKARKEPWKMAKGGLSRRERSRKHTEREREAFWRDGVKEGTRSGIRAFLFAAEKYDGSVSGCSVGADRKGKRTSKARGVGRAKL